MDKSFATDDHAELLESSDGKAFQFFDRSDQMTKAASDVISRQDIADHMPPHSHFGVHLITMGAEEVFGANRNGDSASIASLTNHHPTFEKYGCVYREHANRCPRTQGVGQVKLARFNPKMGRGELIVWVEKDKAPDMYKKAKAGEELSWSMSMRLPHDECSCCGQKSANTAQYCDHLKRSMLKWVPGFEKFAYARNEDRVKFFDISEVKRRADRIATYLGYSFAPEDMAKAASESEDIVIPGAAWAEYQFGPSAAAMDPWEELTLEKMAAAAEFVRNADEATLKTLAGMVPSTLSDAQIETMANPDFRSVAGELSKRAMFVDFHTFAAIITGRPVSDLQKDASVGDVIDFKLPGVLEAMTRAGGCRCGFEALDAVSPDPVGCTFSPDKDNIDRLMGEVGDELGMKPEEASNRALKITIIKAASVGKADETKELDPFYDAMAEAYAGYLVKTAHVAKDLPDISENTLFRGLAASLLITTSKRLP